MTVLVTGAAGFIGSHVCEKLLAKGHEVVGLDNLTPYYSVQLKKDRLARLLPLKGFTFLPLDIKEREATARLFAEQRFDYAINLAAQPGVRYSIEHPESYVDSNLVGFGNILEGCRHSGVKHLVYASSSSVYGLNTRMPFSVHDNVDHPISLYAATKKANELMAHCYSHLYRLPTTGLRFFTVYGPWGRPDMSHFLFVKAIFEGKPIQVFNHGKMRRDFTYIDDIVEGVVRVMDAIPEPNLAWDGQHPDPGTSPAPYRIFNIGNNNSIELEEYITAMEEAIGKPALRNYVDMQPGDVQATYADVDDLAKAVGFRPTTDIRTGIAKFVEWYRRYYGV
ncbi:MAG: NAD-dependent epimerase [Desulfocurvibacter africanus]